MKIIGVTGGIGSGKSTVCTFASQMYGIPVINADELSRKAAEDADVKKQLKDAFGDDIFSSGVLNRKKMAQLVFANEDERHRLNSIIHPKVRDLFVKEVEKCRQASSAFVIYECPLLIEAGLTDDVDVIVLVHSPKEERLRNIINRDNLSVQQAENRISSQMASEDKIKYADVVIYNDGWIDDLKNAVRIAFDKII